MSDENAGHFHAIEASTGKSLEPAFPVSTLAELDRTCAAAFASFDAYRELPSERRAEFLEAIGEEISALGDALLDRAHAESGLPMARLVGERGRTVGQLELFAQVVRAEHWRGIRIDPACPDRIPLPRPDLRLRHIPVGPVAVFGASNFPLAFSTAGGDTASALAAGCPVVVKGHPAHPGTSAMVAGAISKAADRTGMPNGVFGHVQGPGTALGEALVRDSRIAAVGFTGSRSGGLALSRIANERAVPIPVFAEMSSINPVILMPRVLSRRAGELGTEFVASLTMGAGQFCTNPGLLIAVKGEGLTEFEESAIDAIGEHAPQPMLTGGIRSAYAQGVERLGQFPGVRELASGQPGNGVTCEAARLFAVEGAIALAHPDLLQEVFGASSLIVRCTDFAELKDVLLALEGQLTATIHMDEADYEQAASLLPILERTVGRILANSWPTGVEVAHAMVHGGPFPATTDGRSTSVGTLAIYRFLRPVCYQSIPQMLLPRELRDGAQVPKMIDGKPA